MVHEELVVSGKVGQLYTPLKHFPHPSVADFLKEINYYSSLRALELYEQGDTANFMSIVFYTKAKFIQNYLLKRGFLDGNKGLILALIMSFYSFLVRAKLWLILQKKK